MADGPARTGLLWLIGIICGFALIAAVVALVQGRYFHPQARHRRRVNRRHRL